MAIYHKQNFNSAKAKDTKVKSAIHFNGVKTGCSSAFLRLVWCQTYSYLPNCRALSFGWYSFPV